MAEKILNTRIALKIDTLENWSSSTLPLKKGELALATVAASAGTGLTEPVVMAKIGEDGVKTFKDLEWNFYAKAADVLAACKNEASLTAFINGVIADAGIATDEALSTLAGRVTTAEGKITDLEGELNTAETGLKARMTTAEGAIDALEGLVGEKNVATQISEAIAALNLATTYEAKGEAAKVQTALNEYKTTNDAAVQKNASDISGEIARAKAAEEANTNAISAIKDGTTIDSFKDVEEALAGKETAGAAAQALVDAKAYADGLAGDYDDKGAAAQALADAKSYADGLAVNYDASGSAAQALADAKEYTDDEIAEWVGDKTVGVQISEAITGLDLANTYDAKGAAAQALVDAKTHANGLDTAMNARVEALEAIDHDHANKSELDLIVSGDKAKWDAMEQNAKDYADGLNTTMDGRVADLEAMFGDGEGTVEAQIAAAVAAEAGLREAADTALSNRVKAIEDDYLVEADKTALQDQIDALDELVGDESVAKQISDAVAAEAEIARAAEKANADAIKAIKDDYLTSVEEKELQDQITANANAIELLTNGVSADEVDGVNDLIQYVKDHGSEVTGIKADIKANSDAIDAIEADYLKAADKTALQEQITANDGEIAALQTAVGTKAAQSDLEALAGRVSTVEGDLNAETTGLKAKMTAAEADIDALEGKVGDKTVATQITEAIEALKIGDYAKAADLTAAIARIAQNETDIGALKGRMDTAEADIDALETEVAKKANDADLAAIAKTGNVNDLIQTEGDVLVFDCGTSAV